MAAQRKNTQEVVPTEEVQEETYLLTSEELSALAEERLERLNGITKDTSPSGHASAANTYALLAIAAAVREATGK